MEHKQNLVTVYIIERTQHFRTIGQDKIYFGHGIGFNHVTRGFNRRSISERI